MSVVNFKAQRGACDLLLLKFLVEADPGNDANTYKLYLQFVLASRADAEVMGEMLPGLGESFDLAGEDDNWKSTSSVKPADSIRVVLAAKDAGPGQRQGVVKPGEPIIQGMAELLELKASQSKKARTVLARLVFRGQGPGTAERLADTLGRTVHMDYERAQGSLFSQPAKTPPLRPGMVVAASTSDGKQVVGRLVEIDGDVLSLQECGTEVTVEASAVISGFAFAVDADTQAALRDYADRCDRREVAVSWAALSQAMGVLDGGGRTRDVQVTSEHVEAAVGTLGGTEPTPDQPVETSEDGTGIDIEPGETVTLRLVPTPAPSTPRRRKSQAAALA